MNIIDFHIHSSTGSDGKYSVEELIEMADRLVDCTAPPGWIAITDHNCCVDIPDTVCLHPDINVLRGTELSCLYETSDHKMIELHILGIDISDPGNDELQRVFRQNNPDRRTFVEKMMYLLKNNCGINIGSTVDEISSPGEYLGRLTVAKALVKNGYASSTVEAYDRYIGALGTRICYVPFNEHYVSLEEGVQALLSAGTSVISLAHPLFYQQPVSEIHKLLVTFKDLTGERGAIETEYSYYSRKERDFLQDEFARKHKLLQSCGSDFHGHNLTDSLQQSFDIERIKPLLEVLQVRR